MITQVITAILEMFGMFAIGALVMHIKLIEEQDLNRLSRLIIDIFFPMLAFSSITKNLDPSQIVDLWQMPLLGFGLMAFGGVVGFAFRYGMKSRGQGRMETFHFFCVTNNYAFLPLILLDSLWGKEYLPLLFIMNIGSTIGFWTIGVGVLGGGHFKQTLKNIFTINLAAVILALLFSLARWPVPVALGNVFQKFGDAAMPLMFMVIGAALYNNAGGVLKNRWDVCYLSLVRLVILPLIIVFVLKQLPISIQVYRVAFVVALMPVSASSAVITRQFGGAPEFAAQAVVICTLASIVTIPLMLWLL